jgi:hypothetical protein
MALILPKRQAAAAGEMMKQYDSGNRGASRAWLGHAASAGQHSVEFTRLRDYLD